MKNFKRTIYAFSAGSSFEKAILKSVYPGDTEVPKEKHIQMIIWTLQGENSSISADQGFRMLIKHLSNNESMTVLKALFILHRSLFYINSSIRSAFCHSDISVGKTSNSALQSLIKNYVEYVRCLCYNSTRECNMLSTDQDTIGEVVRKFPNIKLIKELGYMIKLLFDLCTIISDTHQYFMDNYSSLMVGIINAVVQDSKLIYKISGELVQLNIDRFKHFSLSLACLGYYQYRKFVAGNQVLKDSYELVKRVSTIHVKIPKLLIFPDRIVNEMEAYINQLDGEAKDVEMDLRTNLVDDETIRKSVDVFYRVTNSKPLQLGQNPDLLVDFNTPPIRNSLGPSNVGEIDIMADFDSTPSRKSIGTERPSGVVGNIKLMADFSSIPHRRTYSDNKTQQNKNQFDLISDLPIDYSSPFQPVQIQKQSPTRFNNNPFAVNQPCNPRNPFENRIIDTADFITPPPRHNLNTYGSGVQNLPISFEQTFQQSEFEVCYSTDDNPFEALFQ